MQRDLDEAQTRSNEGERKLDRVLGEYMESFEKDMGRPQQHHEQGVANDAQPGHSKFELGQRL